VKQLDWHRHHRFKGVVLERDVRAWDRADLRQPEGRVNLTAQEQQHVRTAIRFLRARIGDLETLAKALHCQDDSLSKILRGSRGVTPSLAFMVARFAGVSFDTLIGGHGVPSGGTCARCGHAPDASAAAR
jgi:transcriptional regulator with XRE-family HTH domain